MFTSLKRRIFSNILLIRTENIPRAMLVRYFPFFLYSTVYTKIYMVPLFSSFLFVAVCVFLGVKKSEKKFGTPGIFFLWYPNSKVHLENKIQFDEILVLFICGIVWIIRMASTFSSYSPADLIYCAKIKLNV